MSAISLGTRTTRRDVNHVVALFPDSLLAFDLPRNATLEDLAERLADFGERVHGTPISVAVRRAS